MIVRRKPLPRRLFLKGTVGGVSAAVALPIFDAALDEHGTAFADGTALPTRFGVYWFGGGNIPERWNPVSADPTDSEELRPLARHKDYLSTITGLHVPQVDGFPAPYAHHTGVAMVLTGHEHERLGDMPTRISTVRAPSVDRHVVAHHQGKTPFSSLEIGVVHSKAYTEGSNWDHTSHLGPGQPIMPERSPRDLYNRLFRTSRNSPQMVGVRSSILDLVRDQSKSLQGRLGAADKQRLDQHMTGLREIEQQFARPLTCAEPDVDVSTDLGSDAEIRDDDIRPKNALFAKILAAALACDLTRVFTYSFSQCGSPMRHQTTHGSAFHPLSHNVASLGLSLEESQNRIHNAVVFTMDCTADFFDAFRARKEGDADLLHNSSILCTTEHSFGYSHRYTEFPVIIAGRGSGRLDAGKRYQVSSKPVTHATLTAVRAAGVPMASFGERNVKVTTTLPPLVG